MKEPILISVDVNEIRKVLGKLEPEQQNVALKKALKLTAEQARDRLGKKAQETYTVKKTGFIKAMKIRATSGMVPSATIRSDGKPLPLKDFKVSKAGRTTRAQVLKHGSLKKLERGGIKAFVNNIADKEQTRKKDTAKGKKGSKVRHIAVAQRDGKQRLGIKEKYSNSIPVMLGSKKYVYGLVEPYIADNLQENLKKFVDQALGG